MKPTKFFKRAFLYPRTNYIDSFCSGYIVAEEFQTKGAKKGYYVDASLTTADCSHKTHFGFGAYDKKEAKTSLAKAKRMKKFLDEYFDKLFATLEELINETH